MADQSPEEFVAALPPKRQREAEVLLGLYRRVTGDPGVVDRTGIGFGRYRYRYASGRAGESAAQGFAPARRAITIYLMDGVGAHESALARLGPHTTGVGCVYIPSLDAIDLTVLEGIIAKSFATLTAGVYPLRAREGRED
ncbi:MAG: DUF1801 domain-containing protein [Bauldia sp.]|nr:DUF1801 domain-containing protein [Bauldia sp.]